MSQQVFNRKLFKSNAKAKLRGNWSVAIAIAVVAMVFQGFLGATIGLLNFMVTGGSSAIDPASPFSFTPQDLKLYGMFIGLGLFTVLFSFIFSFATSKWALNVVTGRAEVGIGDFLGSFRSFFKACGAGIWQHIWLMLWYLLFNLPAAIAFAFGVMAYDGRLGADMASVGIIAVGISVVLYLLCAVVMIIKSLSYSQMYYVLAEGGIGIRRSLRLSKKLTRDNIGDLFVLGLSFILWLLAVTFTAGLAMFYVFPYMLATYAEAYVFLRDQAFETGVLDPSEFGLRRVEKEALADEANALETTMVTPSTPEFSEADQTILIDKVTENDVEKTDE